MEPELKYPATETGRSGPSHHCRGCTHLARMLAMAMVALLTACGGAGGGGSSSPGGGGGVTLSGDVYPLSAGDRRSWRLSAGGPSGGLRHERADAAVSLGGTQAIPLRGEGGEVEYLQRTATGVTSLPGPGSDALSIAVGPVEVLRFGTAVGDTVRLFDRALTFDLDADGRPDSVELRVDSSFVGIEAVTTAAGSFPDAARVRTVVRSVVRVNGQAGSTTITVTSDDWYASGVGPVRSTTTTVSDGVPPQTDSEEVIAYGVGGRRSESIAPTLLTSTPAADASHSNSQPVTLVFSETLDPLSLDGPTGLLFVNAAGQGVPASRSIDSTGAQITLFPQPQLADGRYEMRSGGSVTDLAGNLLPTSARAFFVDTRGPRVVASVPANDSNEAPLTGTLRLSFDEPVFAVPGRPVQLRVIIFPGFGEGVLLPAEVQGRDVVATLATPLERNREYLLQVASPLTDASGNPPSGDAVSVRFRTEPGTLARPTASVPDADVNVVRLADFDRDGRADLLFGAQQIGSSVHFIALRPALPGGGFGPLQRLYSFPEFATCGLRDLAVLDANGDGRSDLVTYGDCAPSPVTVLLQQPDGSFTGERPALNLSVAQFERADIDGDAREELVGAQGNTISFLRREGNGQWTALRTLDTGGFIVDWQLVDLNGDGRADLLWVSSPTAGVYELAWSRQESGGFGPVQRRTLGSNLNDTPRLVLGDLDGDGRPDAALALRNVIGGTQNIAVLRQDATGAFAAEALYTTTFNPDALAVADIDGDGRADLLVGHGSSAGLGVYLQTAAGTLQAERLFEATSDYYRAIRALAATDVNGDGRPDVVLANDVILGRAAAGAVWPLHAAHTAQATQAIAEEKAGALASGTRPATADTLTRGGRAGPARTWRAWRQPAHATAP